MAYDEYGNTSEQFSSVGPVNTLNNSLRASNITLSVTSSGSTTASSFEMSALDSLNITATLTSEGEALPLQNMSLRIGAGDFVHSMQGTTDENGVWHAVSVDDGSVVVVVVPVGVVVVGVVVDRAVVCVGG